MHYIYTCPCIRAPVRQPTREGVRTSMASFSRRRCSFFSSTPTRYCTSLSAIRHVGGASAPRLPSPSKLEEGIIAVLAWLRERDDCDNASSEEVTLEGTCAEAEVKLHIQGQARSFPCISNNHSPLNDKGARAYFGRMPRCD